MNKEPLHNSTTLEQEGFRGQPEPVTTRDPSQDTYRFGYRFYTVSQTQVMSRSLNASPGSF